ncbi:MAG: Gfo/Idh/MocA family oxidoreductase [Bacteroidota bacterium]
MATKHSLNRREFLSTAAATTASLSIVPSHVLGGPRHIAPSDKIAVANIGCGTQGLREMGRLLQHPEIQVTALCDPNTYSTDYLDWSANGIRNNIRRVLGKNTWGEGLKGIPGGREVAQNYVEAYYAGQKNQASFQVSAYEDFRELLAKETEVDVVKIMTPDHLHATIAIAAMRAGKDVVMHKPIANRMKEGRLTIDAAHNTGAITHLLAWKDRPQYTLIREWIDAGLIGTLKEIHNWSYRPVWPQWPSIPTKKAPIPKGFNWDLWLGPEQDRPYHPHYTHNVFRGWYDFGGGSIADMGHYSLFPLFETMGIEVAPTQAQAYGTTLRTVENNVCKWIRNEVAFPYSCMVKLKFPKQKRLPAFDLYWYDGGMKPFEPDELEVEGKELEREGMLFVGDKGKILGGFHGENPRLLLPQEAIDAYPGRKELREMVVTPSEAYWVSAVKTREESPGSFLRAGALTEMVNLAAIALRTGKKIKYDSESMRITNDEKANEFLTRAYRKGWELA